jgi:hypothetical protein
LGFFFGVGAEKRMLLCLPFFLFFWEYALFAAAAAAAAGEDHDLWYVDGSGQPSNLHTPETRRLRCVLETSDQLFEVWGIPVVVVVVVLVGLVLLLYGGCITESHDVSRFGEKVPTLPYRTERNRKP